MQRLLASKKLVLLNQSAQARGIAGKLCIHAVFVCRLVFRDSRTAG
jgi:hypothetical protein